MKTSVLVDLIRSAPMQLPKTGQYLPPAIQADQTATDGMVGICGLEEVFDDLNLGRPSGPWATNLKIRYRRQDATVRIEILPDGILQATSIAGQPAREAHYHSSVAEALLSGILRVMTDIAVKTS